jgi:hypothetical protein
VPAQDRTASSRPGDRHRPTRPSRPAWAHGTAGRPIFVPGTNDRPTGVNGRPSRPT